MPECPVPSRTHDRLDRTRRQLLRRSPSLGPVLEWFADTARMVGLQEVGSQLRRLRPGQSDSIELQEFGARICKIGAVKPASRRLGRPVRGRWPNGSEAHLRESPSAVSTSVRRCYAVREDSSRSVPSKCQQRALYGNLTLRQHGSLTPPTSSGGRQVTLQPKRFHQ